MTKGAALEGWDHAYKIATAFVLGAFPFIHAPPSHSLAESAWDWQRLVVYLVALIILLKGGVLAGKQRGVCIGCVVFGLIFLAAYFYLYHKFSCPLEQGRLVIGWNYTDAAAALQASDANQICTDILRSFASDPFRVYEDDGIYANEIILAVLYVGMLTVLSAAILCWVFRTARSNSS